MAGRDSSYSDLSLIQWNCRGFRGKRAPLQLLIPTLPAVPQILLLQDTQHQAKLPSYHAVHSDTTDTPRVSTLIHRTIAYQEHTITSSTSCVLIEIIPTKHNRRPIFIANIYHTPRQPMAALDAVLQKIHSIAGHNPLLIGGDLNSQHTDWGYRYTTARGRRLWTTIQDLRQSTRTFIHQRGLATV